MACVPIGERDSVASSAEYTTGSRSAPDDVEAIATPVIDMDRAAPAATAADVRVMGRRIRMVQLRRSAGTPVVPITGDARPTGWIRS
ncbi:hypothetical protein GCM10027059_05310 [Myceligenerans halotolerans]